MPRPFELGFVRIPVPLSLTVTIRRPPRTMAWTRTIPVVRPRKAWLTALPTASLTASLTSSAGAPTSRASFVTVSRAGRTLFGSAGSSTSTCGCWGARAAFT